MERLNKMMPEMMAKKIADLSYSDLLSLLISIRVDDTDAYRLIREKLEEII